LNVDLDKDFDSILTSNEYHIKYSFGLYSSLFHIPVTDGKSLFCY